MKPRVKVYGERNVGSRYLSELLARNLDVTLLRGAAPSFVTALWPDSEAARDWYFRRTMRRNLGWKHRLPPDAAELAALGARVAGVRFVTVVKNPYAWLLSLLRRPYSAGRAYASVEELVTQPWRTVGRECAPPQFADAVAMWNAKYGRCLALPRALTVNLRYEDLLADPAAQLERLALQLELPRLGSGFVNVEASTKRSVQGFDDYRRFYLEQRWREKLTDREVALISERLDPAVVAGCGYALL